MGNDVETKGYDLPATISIEVNHGLCLSYMLYVMNCFAQGTSVSAVHEHDFGDAAANLHSPSTCIIRLHSIGRPNSLKVRVMRRI